jgi:hypothetical protein
MSMPTPNEFWLALHALYEAYESEGLTPEERADSIAREFEKMPPAVQRQVLHEFQNLSSALLGVGLQVTAARQSSARETPSQHEMA